MQRKSLIVTITSYRKHTKFGAILFADWVPLNNKPKMKSKMCDENLTQVQLEMERNQINSGKLLRKLLKTKMCLKHSENLISKVKDKQEKLLQNSQK